MHDDTGELIHIQILDRPGLIYFLEWQGLSAEANTILLIIEAGKPLKYHHKSGWVDTMRLTQDGDAEMVDKQFNKDLDYVKQHTPELYERIRNANN